jgi:D-alanyl-D-alanine carboxypeptidase (penicillin-binding protein 5/6)
MSRLAAAMPASSLTSNRLSGVFMRCFLAAVFLSFVLAAPAQAALDTRAEHALLMDGESGQVLWHKNGMVPMAPASMSKLMTTEMIFQRLKDGRLKLTDTFMVSERAWRQPGSRGFTHVGDRLTVEDLIRRIVIVSGNDACIVVAEGLGGTVENFVKMMNARARELGMAQSTFVNPDGLPDPPGQLMSALDLAKLSRHLVRDYPVYYRYFSEKEYTIVDRKNKITQPNRDLVLGMLPGADGLKTGHTDLAGYGITSSAKRGEQRLILVLNGLRYPEYSNDYFPNIRRAEEATRILDLAFREFRRYPLYAAGQVIGQAPVLEGAALTVAVTARAPVAVTMPVESKAGLKTGLKLDAGLTAPIAQGQRIGVMTVSAPNFPGMSVPVYAAQAVPQANIAVRLWRAALGLVGW